MRFFLHSIMASPQSSSRVIMIRPACFSFITESAAIIPFQNIQYAKSLSADDIHERALKEFDRMVEQLRSHGVHVDVFDDTSSPVKPDAIFPNNWFSTHSDGTIVLYSMVEQCRRYERRLDLIEQLKKTHHVTAVIDLSPYEERDQHLEGTGSLVLDRENKIVYAVQSPHTHETIVEHFAKVMNYQQPPILIEGVDGDRNPIYHTNVMMAIGTKLAILCSESIPDKEQRDRVVKLLEQNGKRKIIDITMEQLNHFAGNALELQNAEGQYLLTMSKSAHSALTNEQKKLIEETNTKIIHFDIDNIEQCGGGSVRCMIAENFLPQNA
jgi:hypothetical protein